MPARTLFWTCALTFSLATAAHAAITISSHKTKDESCTAGICTPTGPNPNIRVKDLQKLLAHSDVKIVTGQGSTGIGVLDPLTWASKHLLTLDANQSIHVRAPIVVEGTGGVTLITNDGGTGGDYYFDAPGSISFWDLRSVLIANGRRFKLVGDIKTLASRIQLNPDGDFALAKSLDASVDGTYHVSPVASAFDGGFEGLGNTISHLTIQGTKNNTAVGLFAQLGQQGVIRDILLDDVNVSKRSAPKGPSGVGALVAVSSGQVLQSQASGSVSCITCGNGAGPTYVGGLVGNGGSIVGSHASVTVSGGSYSGGLAGNAAIVSYSDAHGDVSSDVIDNTQQSILAGLVATAGSIDHSTATGAITGTGSTSDGAGLAGIADTVTYSSASGTVTSPNSGGLVIEIRQSLTQSHATGDVSGKLYAGGLALENNDTVSDSYATGEVTCTGNVCFAGGLIATQFGTTTRSYATGAVSGGNNTGGLIGQNGGSVVSCFATGTVQTNVSSAAVGGLAGAGGNISLSFATGSVSGGAKSSAGGLVGFGGVIQMSFASGSVSAGDNANVGGLTGTQEGGLSQSYATGSVTGGIGAYVGGLAGYAESSEISEIYATGLVTGGLYRGGLVGHLDPSALHAYWDTDTSGVSNLSQGDGDSANFPGITGITDSQLKSALPDGFSPSVWGQSPNINNGWPYLLANPPKDARRKHK